MKGLYFASWASVAALALCIALAGCAAMPGGDHEPSDDPLEPLNRVVLDTNTALDNAFIKPMAEIYRQIVPQLVRDRIRDAIVTLRQQNLSIYDIRKLLAEQGDARSPAAVSQHAAGPETTTVRHGEGRRVAS